MASSSRSFRPVILTAALLALPGCAYFNTFYNARQSYSEALRSVAQNPDNPSSTEEEDLRKAIEGAGKVLSFYPDSRWADDAQLLIGDALLLLGDRSVSGSGTSNYEEAMRAYSSVMVMTGSERMRDQAAIGIGRSAMALGRFTDASASFRAVGSRREDLYVVSRLCLAEALVSDGRPADAMRVVDSLESLDLPDSLRAELFLAASSALSAMGAPDSAAHEAEEAGRLFGRGPGYYRAFTTAAEAYIEAGNPSKAADILYPLRASYSTSIQLAAISLLSGRAGESAGDIPLALSSYEDAAELDGSRGVGAEALYRRALLLERENRLDEAITALDQLSGRGGSYLWIRLASDRFTELSLLDGYIDSVESGSSDDVDLYRFLADEKRFDLYGYDESTGDELRTLMLSSDGRVRAMSLALLAERFTPDADDARLMLEDALALADSGDLAGRIETALGLNPGESAPLRPSSMLESAWLDYDSGNFLGAWETATRALSSRWRLDAEPALLWMAYLSSEAAQMDDGMVEGYLTELTGRYPFTPEGVAASGRLGGTREEDGE